MPIKMTLIALAIMASTHVRPSTVAPLVSLAETYQDGIDVSQYWYSENWMNIRAYGEKHLVTRNGTGYTL